MTTLVKSKATSKVYVQAQVRARSDTLHIQIPLDTEVNRDYGIAFDIQESQLPNGVLDALREAQAISFSNDE